MLIIYRCLINLLFPLIVIITYLRVLFNKEDKNRLKEKLFSSSFDVKKNYNKKLIWFHAASIGELKSIIPLIKILNKDRKFEFLITTLTLSSSKLISEKDLREGNIIHRFFPFDKPSLVKKFINEWKPSIVLFIDSEIWPNFLLETNRKQIPLILLNARITKKTFLKWKLIPKTAAKIFKSFDLCLASNNESKKNLDNLKAKNVKYFGNIKLAAEDIFDSLSIENTKILKNNKFWCAISIHKGEDIFCLKTHLMLKKIHKNIITIIIPRHIDGIQKIKLSCDRLNLNSQILSNNELIKKNKEIILVNSYGVISSYLALCRSIFVGKSMIKKLKFVGGQNPIEAAKLGCKIYHGPHVYNFQEIYELFNKYKISEIIYNEAELANKLGIDLFNSNPLKNDKIETINNLGKKILNDTFNELNKIIKQ